MKILAVLVVAAAAGIAHAQKPKEFDPAQMQKQLEALQQMMEANAKATPLPVDHRELKALLPEQLGDLKRTAAKSGKQSTMGITVVNAEGEYEGPKGAKARVTIIDTSGAGAFGAAAAMGVAALDINNETDDGYERTVRIGDYKALEEYNHKEKSGKITVFVGQFNVVIDASGIAPEALKTAAAALDLKRLAGLKPAAP